MRIHHLILVAAAAVALLVVVVLSVSSPDPGPPASAPDKTEDDSEPDIGLPPPPEEPEPAPDPGDPEPADAGASEEEPVPSGTVRGTVVDESGAPLSVPCAIDLEYDWSRVAQTRPSRRRASGSARIEPGSQAFEIPGVSPGTYVARARADGYQVGKSASFVVKSGETVGDVAIVMARGGSVSGIVVRGRTGEPVAGAVVSVVPGGNMVFRMIGMQGGNIRFAGQQSEKTDEQGRFLITGIKPGTYGVMATAKDLTPGRLGEVKVEQDRETGGLLLSLGEGGAITGTVYGADGKPEPKATVLISRVDPRIQIHGDFGQRVTADEQGVYFVDHLEPGDYRVRRPSGGNAMSISVRVATEVGGGEKEPEASKDPELVTVREGQVTRRDLYAERGCSLLVRVMDGEGNPLRRLVSLRSLRETEADVGSGPRVVVPMTGHTWKAGEHEFKGLEAGPYQVVAEGQQREVVLSPGERKTVEFRIQVGAVEGVVRDQEGLPVAGARVTLRRLQEPGGGSASFSGRPGMSDSNENGRFAVAEVAPGRYVAIVRLKSRTGRSDEFSVSPGEKRTGVEVLLDATVTVTIEFMDAQGKALAHAQALLFDSGNPQSGWRRGRIDARGIVEMELTPGRYRVFAQVGDDQRPGDPGEIDVGRSAGQRFSLRVK